MKKLLTIMLVMICLTLTGTLTACNGTYYTLVFELPAGVTIDSEVMSGAKVLDGYTVTFGLDIEEEVNGTPIVKANGSALTLDANGKYSFVMKADTTIAVTNLFKTTKKDITFDIGADRISYHDEEGNDLTTLSVSPGTEVKFGIDISVFYLQEGYEVLANTEIITPDANGIYTVTVDDDTTVSVSGLTQEENFTNRADGGRGTVDEPFKISRPIDFFYMSVLVNDDWYAGSAFNTAHYELACDIDMEGEEIFVIGDQTSSTAFFGGTFNGKGHTVSNFVINGFKYDANGLKVNLPYVGFFGCLAATQYQAPHVYNLNLTDFTVEVNGMGTGGLSAVGGIAGMTVGGNITGCSVTDASITVAADLENFSYVGGIVGVHQSAYSTDEIRFYSSIRSCYTNASVGANSGYAYGAGGIVGLAMSYEERTTAFIINCYSEGSTYGAFNTGGIVGSADANTSVIGCYSTGEVEAQSSINTTGSASADIYAYAYAGGIAGTLANDAIITDSFSDSSVYSYAVAGSSYAKKGDIVAKASAAGEPDITSGAAVVLNSYGKEEKSNFKSAQWIKETLKWSDADWVIEDGAYPTVNLEETSKTFTVTVSYGEETVEGESANTVQITDTYIPMAYWNIVRNEDGVGEVIPEFIVSESGKRSYGYYFDEQLTEKVPYGYIPTRDITIYAGWADYSEVVGKYFVLTNGVNDEIYLELTGEGVLRFVDGARILTSSYTYDGERIILNYTSIARLGAYADETLTENANSFYYSYAASVENGILTVTDYEFYPEGSELKAKKISDGFSYGEYINASDYYAFYRDGKGVKSVGGNRTEFTFEINGNGTLTITGSGSETTATVGNETVTIGGVQYAKSAGIVGKWSTDLSGIRFVYTFNNDGTWTQEKVTYETDGSVSTESTASGTYESTQDGYACSVGGNEQFTVKVDGNGFITVVSVIDGATVSVKANDILTLNPDFKGEWAFFNIKEQVVLTLNGIGADGVGSGAISYSVSGDYDITYQIVNANGESVLEIYDGDLILGALTFNDETYTLDGDLLWYLDGAYRTDARFMLCDAFVGEWTVDGEDISSLHFDGYGLYDMRGTTAHIAVNGTVYINGEDRGVKYSVSSQTFVAAFTYDGVEYSVSLLDGKLNIAYTGGSMEGARYDEWKNIALHYNNEAVYTFNGQSNVGAGVVYINGQAAGTYSVNEDILTISPSTGEANSVILTVESNDYKLYPTEDPTQGITLYLVNDFTGSWVNSNDEESTLTVGDFSASLTATGSYLGDTVTFTLDIEKNRIAFTYKGVELYAYAVGEKLVINTVDNAYGSISFEKANNQ